MNKCILILIVILFLVMIKKKSLDYDRKFLEYDMKIKNACSSMENFVVNLDDKMDSTAVTNMLSIAKGEKIVLKSLVITGDVKIGGSLNVDGDGVITGNNTVNGGLTVSKGGTLGGNYNIGGNVNIGGTETVNGLFTVKNGSRFSGGRHLFNDEEKNDCWLRVGVAWGHPGIYAENNRPLTIGGSDGNVNIPVNLNVSGNSTAGTILTNGVNVIDNINGKFNNVQNTANDAVNRANNAQNTANDAVGKANNAQNTANDANNNANGRQPAGNYVKYNNGIRIRRAGTNLWLCNENRADFWDRQTNSGILEIV